MAFNCSRTTAAITDYGTLAATFSLIAHYVDGPTPAVPEPSTYMLTGLGRIGLAFASKRARRACFPPEAAQSVALGRLPPYPPVGQTP